ncbi:glycoside hydrolase family 16 protein [Nigerium massiliense]|uniref:glycoside hydrolase family 16 protein n=1 Tax=Nigerium massiliense TaxID=1522317 RepID=UPI00058B9C73|nr:glycoside hydrolase family 16 protein [Nigerium massiliense]
MRTPSLRRGLAAATLTALALGAFAPSAGAAPASTQDARAPFAQEFDSWTDGALSPDGAWRINGDWVGSRNNMMLRSNAQVSGGYLSLVSRGNQLSGAEIQTIDQNLGLGYYETSMKASDVPGILSTFFFMSDGYRFPEVDMEIRSVMNGPGKQHFVNMSLHQTDEEFNAHAWAEPVDFDPAAGFHRYGYAIKRNSVDFYIDGKLVKTFDGLRDNLGADGGIDGELMLNSWAGNDDWFGPIPTRDTLTQYDYVRYWPGATGPQN